MTCGRVPAGRSPAECCDGHVPDACCQQIVSSRRMATLSRDAGLGQALAADPRWTAGAMQAIEELAKAGQEFTADTLRRKVGAPSVPAAMGAVFAAAASQGLIRRVHDHKSDRVKSHRRRLGAWVGKQVPVQESLEEATTNG